MNKTFIENDKGKLRERERQQINKLNIKVNKIIR